MDLVLKTSGTFNAVWRSRLPPTAIYKRNRLMNVNQKGTQGLIEVIKDLYSKEFHCYLPFDDYAACDLIATKSDVVYRLQIKYRSKTEKDRYEIPISSVVNGVRIPIDMSLIDGWAVYLEEQNQIAYIPKSLITTKSSFIISQDRIKDISLWRTN